MKNVYSFAASLLLIFVGGTALAQNTASSSGLAEAAEVVAKKELDSRASETFLAPIRSQAELETYLGQRKTSPFNALSPRSLKLFLDSLVFTEKGLASYRYKELEAELSPRQAVELLSLFGAQKTVSSLDFAQASAAEKEAVAKIGPIFNEDHKGYRCVPPATCMAAMDMICVGANCGMYTP